MELWQFLVPPLVGAVVGYGTNHLAVRMFFRPYRPVHIGSWRVPLTPGMISKEHDKLAERIVALITERVLTPDDLHRLAVRLVTEDKIGLAVDAAVDALILDLQNTERLHRLARDVSNLSTGLVSRTLQAIVERSLSGESELFDIASLVDRAIDYLVETFEVTPKLAEFLTDKIFESALSSGAIRDRLIEFLTPDNIETLNRFIKRQAGGGLGFLLMFVNLREFLHRYRLHLEEEPEAAEAMIGHMVEQLKLKEMLHRELISFSLKQLPWATIEFIKFNLSKYLEGYIRDHKESLSGEIVEKLELSKLIYDSIVRVDPSTLPPPLVARLKQEITRFALVYLDRELKTMLEYALRELNLNEALVEKVRQVPSRDLEEIILGLSPSHLYAIVILGGVIGFVVGCAQVVLTLALGGGV